MARKNEDRFSNIASFEVVQSGINVLTYAELVTGISLGTGIGMLIDQIDYIPSAGSINMMTTSADVIVMALATSNTSASLTTISDRRLIHSMSLFRFDMGTAGSGSLIRTPMSYQFFPPMIIAAPRLYLGMASVGLSGAANGTVRVYFRYIDLTDKEYLELAETFILVG